MIWQKKEENFYNSKIVPKQAIMSKVQISEPHEQDGDGAGAPPFAGGFGQSRQGSSQLTTLHEHHAEHMTSAGTILCTQEAMDQAVMQFSEHVDNCNI